MERTYRAALVGCGNMGRNHALALATTPGIRLCALADVHEPSLVRMAEEVGIDVAHRYTSYEAMLDAERPDFVVVATRAEQHAAATISAAARGVHVLCEKPLAPTLAEADAMVAACEQAGVRLAVDHLRRIAPAAQTARDMIAEGAIGDVIGIDVHEKGGRPVGNTLMEMSTHDFDLARFTLSRWPSAAAPADRIEWVFARLSSGLGSAAHAARADEVVPSLLKVPTDKDCGLVVGDRGLVLLGLGCEVQAVARFVDRPRPDSLYDGVDVIGTRGSLLLRGGTIVRLYRRRAHAWAEHDQPELVETPALEELPDEKPAVTYCRAMAREMIGAIEEGREHVSSGRDGLAVLEGIMAVYASHMAGRPVALPLADRGHPLERWRAPILA
jgi:UDP-N-acetyl-2-amino-2-deoxyglucuronate dehydrogenase